MSQMVRVLAVLATAASLWAANEGRPGTVNHSDGQVSIDGAPLAAASSEMRPGQTISTEDGMAELLLTPGSFLRLGNHTVVTIGSLEPSKVKIEFRKGEAMLEAVALPAPGAIVLDEGGATAAIDKPGLYDLNAKRGTFAVYQGSARITKGGRILDIEKGSAAKVSGRLRELQMSPNANDPLYVYSYARSRLLSDENVASAQMYPPGAARSRVPSWYWNPLWNSYSYLPATGFVNGPFGWPFYAPGYTHNYVPAYPGGDSYLYGPPVPTIPDPSRNLPVPSSPPLTVPLNAPGVPTFPSSRSGPPR